MGSQLAHREPHSCLQASEHLNLRRPTTYIRQTPRCITQQLEHRRRISLKHRYLAQERLGVELEEGCLLDIHQQGHQEEVHLDLRRDLQEVRRVLGVHMNSLALETDTNCRPR